MGVNCASTSAWNETKTSPESGDVGPGGSLVVVVGASEDALRRVVGSCTPHVGELGDHREADRGLRLEVGFVVLLGAGERRTVGERAPHGLLAAGAIQLVPLVEVHVDAAHDHAVPPVSQPSPAQTTVSNSVVPGFGFDVPST